MSYTLTLQAGLVDVALPNGQIAQGEQIAILTDDEYAQLSSTSGALFSSAAPSVDGDVSTVTSFRPVYLGGDDPYAEVD